MRFLPLLLLLAACAQPVKETCTQSTCDDAVGTWDVFVNRDGGCSYVRVPKQVTFYRDGGALCITGTTQLIYEATNTLKSDGACGLSLRIDEGAATGFEKSVSTDQTWNIAVTAGTFSGSNKMFVCCDISCSQTTDISGTRR